MEEKVLSRAGRRFWGRASLQREQQICKAPVIATSLVCLGKQRCSGWSEVRERKGKRRMEERKGEEGRIGWPGREDLLCFF